MAYAEQKLAEISEKYDADILIYTGENHTYSFFDNSDDFLYYNRYSGDNVVLSVIDMQGIVIYGVGYDGKCYSKMSRVDVLSELDSKDWDGLVRDYIDTVEYVLKHGKLKMSGGSIFFTIAFACVVGLIAGGIRTSSLMKGMKIVPPTAAAEYLVPGSFVIRNKRVDYLYTTVTKTPISTSSGGGGGSRGGSFHSSGHSSGGSFSSGGRRF